MKIINEQLLDETQAKALQSPRLRMNYNFHERLDDPINRLLNAMEPGTYLRPHRHLNPAKDEIFLLLRGKVLESGSVIYEIKQGPFAPLAPENLAPWSPEAEDTEGVKKYLEWLESQI